MTQRKWEATRKTKAQLQKARAKLRKSIIAERRIPITPNPTCVSWLYRLRKSVLRRAVKQGA